MEGDCSLAAKSQLAARMENFACTVVFTRPAPQGPCLPHMRPSVKAATGRRFGDKDFRSGLENGILLCELLSSIKPGLVKKINRLPTPIAGLDNLTLFLRGCEELGLKGSQLFDPGDLQDTSIRANPKGSDCNRKLKNVLITIYWLGKAANSCTTYNGPTLDLKEFEGLLSQMRKEAEDMESPKRNVRDSGYIDCWDSERSDSLSPPRHGRDDSFDSLDSFGSRSQQTPSPDVVIRGSSDGRGSDSETDAPHRKLPDMRKDDMLARRTSYNEPRTMMPFNQYLPNKSNQSAYVPASLRKKRAEREDSRKSWSTATSPIGGERPFSHPEAIQEEGLQPEEGEDRTRALLKTVTGGGTTCLTPPLWEGKDEQEIKKLERLEKAGIRVLPAAIRYSSLKPAGKEPPRGPTPDIILRKDNEFSRMQQEHESDSGEEEEAERRVPDVEKDDLASRRAQMSRGTPRMQQQFLPSSCSSQDRERWERIRRSSQQAALERQQQQVLSETKDSSRLEPNAVAPKEIPPVQPQLQEGQGVSPQALPNALRDDLARRRAHSGPPPQRENLSAFMQASITQSDLEKWERLKMTVETSETEAPSQDSSFGMVARKGSSWVPEEWEEQRKEAEHGGSSHAIPNVQKDDLARRRAQSSLLSQRDAPQSCFQASITQSDLEKWDRLKMTVETRFSHRAASVSDDPESVSMIDMRCEEEAILQPYSQARCELLQNQYNKVREEEDHWQDDLARWKNRRRSASQDLIKKEEERKMMEKLMTVDGAQGHRRKSIKTYKEIVEEKERREQELHEAYRRARTPQEAAAVLQHYALRFTISEAVLERLQLPKQADPGAPPAEPSGPLPLPQPATPPLAPGPMKYLRQQSAPMPKFTSTVEATVVGVTPTQATAAAAPTHPPTRMVLPKTVPLLAPKPYITPRSSQTGLRSIKADGMVRVNGETGEVSGRLENSWGGAKDNGASPVKEAASLPLSPPTTLSSPKKEPEDEMGGRDVGRGAGDEPPAVQEAACVTCLGESEEATPPALAEVEATPIRPSSLPTDLQRESVVSESAEAGNADTQEREDEAKPAAVQQPVTGDGVQDVASAEQEAEEKGPHVRMERGCVVTTTILTELTQTQILPSNMPEMKRAGDEEAPSPRRSEAPPPNAQPPCEAPVSELAYSAGNSRLRWEFFTLPDDQEKDLVNIPTPVLSLPKRVDHWSWDPDEERRRQERWQQEQERMLQEKYQREQEKLKQEWERAQKEVEEEERKYHEEERKILEETVTPLTPTLTPTLPSIFGDSAAPPSPQNTIVRSLADWDRKQELLEKQANEPQQDNNVAQDTGTRNGSSANLTLRSPIPQSTTQTTAVTPGLQNGQQAPLDPSQSSVPQLQFIQDASWASKRPEAQQQDEVWKKTASLDRNWSSQPAQSGGMKRSGSCENVGTHPSKSSPFSSATQPPSPNRSVSGKKLCSSCTHPLGKGAAMIIETLGLYFHIQCFKCGICKGQLGDTSTGTDVRIRNGLLNCHECYIKSRAAGQPTTL
ncbi:LIM and calponin homology domains-containing protein 1a isoform X9 [Brienomyrus brachyistius]|uniref:LIM and calponin homology domains-containing protein 1a isoform X9 n=1 Tax=Brienomyrus brachyistius TaxID=42636 RepID=UPI0020B1A981|nr:LIM and calponin homology domains-containing protein 1a isoform X9 [Brienomyrus brachyistius]